jgi:chromosome segregation ATPase
VEKEQAKCKQEVKALNNKIQVLNDQRIRARSMIEELRQQRAQAQDEEQQCNAARAADVEDKQLVGFGKLAGMTYTDLAKQHYKYLEWCA